MLYFLWNSMTWGGLQGFQTPIQNESFIVDGIGSMGQTHTERGLTYFEVALSGHMYVLHSFHHFWFLFSSVSCRVPQYSPVVR
jgi:hypothetical protein